MHSIVQISPTDLLRYQLQTYPKRLAEERAKTGDAYDIKAISFLREQLWRIKERAKEVE